MEAGKKAFYYNRASLLCGIWFLSTGWAWTYFICLFISYPFAFVGVFLWYKGRKINPESQLNKAALALLLVGFASSVIAIFLYK